MSKPVDINYVVSHHISSYTYFIISVIPFKSAEIRIILKSDTDSRFCETIDMKIDGEAYTLWGNDDSYIDDLVAKKVDELKETNKGI